MAEVAGVLEIGGTHVSAARVELASAAVDSRTRCRIEFPVGGERAVLVQAILEAAEHVAGDGVADWAVAVPGPFDYEHGIFRTRHKLEALYGVDLRTQLAPYATSILFVNDADAFVLGEWWAGAARQHSRVVGITLGTGLGSAFLADGLITKIGPGVPPDGELYVLQFHGAPVEDVLSRRGILARYGAEEGVDVEQVAARARDGESRARETLEQFAAALGEFLAPVLSAFAPSCLVVGGSIARAWDLIQPTLAAGLSHVEALEKITVAANLEDAPLLGAASSVARRS
jgi:glucokinase